MEGRIIFPDNDGLYGQVPLAHRAEFKEQIDLELQRCIKYARSAEEPLIRFPPVRETPGQLILEFEVLDLQKPYKDEYNWHGQNTSQWLYAGAIVYDRETEQISRHH